MSSNSTPNIPWTAVVGAVVIVVGGKIAIDHWVDGKISASDWAPVPALHQLTVDGQLMSAARNGDVAAARRALQDGASVNVFRSNGETAVSAAMRAGSTEIVDLCLAQKFSPATGYPTNDGVPRCLGDYPLFWACGQGRLENVRRLLELGARPEGGNTNKSKREWAIVFTESPMAAAIEHGSIEITDLLIKKGATTYGFYNEGIPLIYYPIRSRNLAMLKYLMKTAGLFNYPVNGMTNFEYAVTQGWVEGASAMVEGGSPPSLSEKSLAGLKDVKLKTQLKHAQINVKFDSPGADQPFRQKAVDVATEFYTTTTPWTIARIKSLPKECFLQMGSEGWTLFCFAVDAGRLDVARLIVAAGAPVNSPQNSQMLFAVKANSLPALEILVGAGASLEACTPGGMTPLGLAIELKNRPIFAWLLAHGARAEPSDGPVRAPIRIIYGEYTEPFNRPERTPLMLAVRANDEFMIKRLVELGANAKQVDCYGESIMLSALLQKNPAIISLLTARGLDPKAEVAKSSHALAGAIRGKDYYRARALLELGVPIQAECFWAAEMKEEPTALFKEFMVKNHDAGAEEEFFWEKVSQRPLVEVADYLAKGGHVNFPGMETPLQLAVRYNRVDVANLLFEKGCDPGLHSYSNNQPIVQYAMMSVRGEGGVCTMIRLLVSHGADIDERTPYQDLDNLADNGQTALMKSVLTAKTEVTRALLDLGASVAIADDGDRTVDYYLEQGVNYTATTRRLVRAWLDEAKKTQTARNLKKKPAA